MVTLTILTILNWACVSEGETGLWSWKTASREEDSEESQAGFHVESHSWKSA